jgi:hypothetical protein
MAGFCELTRSLQAPILGILRAKWPIVSGGHLKNSRFWEIAAGDRVRSALHGELAVQLAEFSALAAGKLGMPSPHCRAETTVQRHKIPGISGSSLGISARMRLPAPSPSHRGRG